MKKKLILAVIAFILAVIGYFSVPDSNIPIKPENEIRVHFIDVGQGDSIFIELKDKTMLIDAGNPENGSDVSAYIKGLGVEVIDYVVGTHPHSDHIGGLAKVIYDFNIGSVYMPRVSHNTNLFYELLETISDKNLTIKTAKAGVVIYNDDTTKIEILSPKKEKYKDMNNYSAVIKLTYMDTSFLFMGDCEKLVEDSLLNDDITCNVLKAGHHGSSTSNSKAFIKKVNPDYAVVSCGVDNDYGHPHIEALTNLSDSKILRTDELGTIIIASDGKELNIL